MVALQTQAVWKDVVGYEGLYQVNNIGEVRSVDRLVNCCGGERTVGARVLKQSRVHYGYPAVRLCRNNICKTFLVHRLVAEAFIPNPNKLPCINHKDANPKNNCIDNLEWCTHKYNSNYPICKERQHNAMLHRYEEDPDFLEQCKQRLDKFHKLRCKKVCQIDLRGNLIKIWDSTASTLSGGFIPNDVGQCANGKRKTHRKFVWVWLCDYERS